MAGLDSSCLAGDKKAAKSHLQREREQQGVVTREVGVGMHVGIVVMEKWSQAKNMYRYNFGTLKG